MLVQNYTTQQSKGWLNPPKRLAKGTSEGGEHGTPSPHSKEPEGPRDPHPICKNSVFTQRPASPARAPGVALPLEHCLSHPRISSSHLEGCLCKGASNSKTLTQNIAAVAERKNSELGGTTRERAFHRSKCLHPRERRGPRGLGLRYAEHTGSGKQSSRTRSHLPHSCVLLRWCPDVPLKAIFRKAIM